MKRKMANDCFVNAIEIEIEIFYLEGVHVLEH